MSAPVGAPRLAVPRGPSRLRGWSPRRTAPCATPAGSTRSPTPLIAAELSASGARAVPWMAVPLVDSTGTRNRAIVVLGRRPIVQRRGRVGPGPAGPDGDGGSRQRPPLPSGAGQRAASPGGGGVVAAGHRRARPLRAWPGGGTARRARCWVGTIPRRRRPQTARLRIPAADEAAASALARLWDRTRARRGDRGRAARRPLRDDELLAAVGVHRPAVRPRGSVTGILAVAEDVTERQRMLEQFQQAERLGAMARLAGGVAHDFNNLLTVILGCSEILLRRIDPADPLVTEVEAIQRAGHRAAALTSQLLAIGHRQVGQPGVVDPDSIVRSMEPMLVRVMGEDVQAGAGPARARRSHPGRPGRDRAGRAEPGHQRPRRHAQRRPPRDPHPRGRAPTCPHRSASWPSPCPTRGRAWTRRPPSTASSPSTPPRDWPREPVSGWPPCTPWSPRPAGR